MGVLVKKWKTEAGLTAWIYLVKNSHHCGYVEVPNCSDIMEDLFEAPFEVHGGITYGGVSTFCDGRYVLGYDCAHAGDACFGYQHTGDVWRDEDFCVAECEKLAKQISGLI